MAVYLIVAEESNPELGEKIKEAFPEDHYVLSNNQWLVDASETTQEIARSLDVIDGKFGRAVVFLVTAHSGFHKQSLWEWMQLD